VDSKTWLIGGGILALIVAVGFACFQWGAADERAKFAALPKDTTVVLHPEYTLPYVAQGNVQSNNKPQSKIRDTVFYPVQDSVMFNSCEREIWMNTVANLNAELAEYKDVDSFSEDSTRYSLAVTWDGSKPINQRFWRWLQIKPYPYTDTATTVTSTLLTSQKMDWPWLVACFAVGAAVMAIFFTAVFK
jgi:hypothetical protein